MLDMRKGSILSIKNTGWTLPSINMISARLKPRAAPEWLTPPEPPARGSRG